MSTSNYVFTEPEPSVEPLDAGTDKLDFQPTSMEPVVIENIVTSKLQDPDETYHVQKSYMATEADGEEGDIPAYCGLIQSDDEKAEAAENENETSALNLDNLTMENIRAYIEGITPKQWKKYALITGGVLLGRRILFGGRK